MMLPMTTWLLLLTLGTKPFFAAAPAAEDTALSSSHADYDGNALILTGQVRLDHGLGKMEAERAVLERQEGNKEFPFAHILLEKSVKLATHAHSEIECARADLDFTQLKGQLFSEEAHPIIFNDASIHMTSQNVDLDFVKTAKDGEKSFFSIQSILAKDGVTIDYSKQLKIIADHAVYKKSDAIASKEFQGVMTAYPKDTQTPCLLIHEEDRIEADTINLDIINATASLVHPRGALSSHLTPQLRKGPLFLSSDFLVWDHKKNLVTLKGNITLDDPNLGSIQAAEELSLSQVVANGKRVVKAIRTHGRTHLKYREPQSQTVHNLICQGSMRFERDKLSTFLESPKVKGKVPFDKQIQYAEKDFSVYCDQAVVDYTVEQQTLHPSSVVLKGNIRLFTQDLTKAKRCALADRVTYSPGTSTLILSASSGKKVLFWDEGQTMRISAQEVHITRDPESKSDTIKGFGQVKFSFSSEESETLKKFFPFITLLGQ